MTVNNIGSNYLQVSPSDSVSFDKTPSNGNGNGGYVNVDDLRIDPNAEIIKDPPILSPLLNLDSLTPRNSLAITGEIKSMEQQLEDAYKKIFFLEKKSAEEREKAELYQYTIKTKQDIILNLQHDIKDQQEELDRLKEQTFKISIPHRQGQWFAWTILKRIVAIPLVCLSALSRVLLWLINKI